MINIAQRLVSAMDDRRAGELMREMLERAGVTVGGDAPWDVRINDPRVYMRVLREGTLGVGDAYVDGWWDTPALDQMIEKILRGRIDRDLRQSWALAAHVVRARLFNPQASRASEVAERHYDVGNDLYEAMLDRRMVYTCAYWNEVDTLEAAQEAKLDLVCRKIGLHRHDPRDRPRVLDLGCGWGGFAAFAAERYGANVVGYTISREQAAWARQRYAGLPIEIRHDDYRNASGSFDAVVSIGLMEHVGPKNHRSYMQLAARCLVPGGVALIHTISGAQARTQIDPWFDKHIFPNAVIPTLGQLATAMEDVLVPEDVQNIGPHYDRTLMAWWERFEAAWPRLKDRYGDRFYRMWKYYLLVSAAEFRVRQHNLIQIVATAPGTAHPSFARST
jgi:cyclopropane-fatty-acyl-phospholipid synthase